MTSTVLSRISSFHHYDAIYCCKVYNTISQVETGNISTRYRVLKIVYKITSILCTLCIHVNSTQYFKIVRAIFNLLIC